MIRVWLIIALLATTACISVKMRGRIHHPITKDGWRLTAEEFQPATDAPARKYPVLFLHGLMSNRYSFLVAEEKSLVAMLARQGYHVFAADFRGRVDAGSPNWFFGKTYSYNADMYARHDLPTLISFVLSKTGKEKVTIVGHSMGGLLSYIAIGSYGEDRVANLITIASPGMLTPANKIVTLGYKARGNMSWMPVVPSRFFASMAGTLRLPPSPPDLNTVVWYDQNMSRQMQWKMMQHGVNNAAKPVMRQFIGAVREGHFRSADGKIDYTGNLKQVDVAALLVAGRRDNLVSVANVRYVYDHIGSTDKTIFTVSRASGASTDYGHVDLVAGKHIAKDVNLPIIEWLNARS